MHFEGHEDFLKGTRRNKKQLEGCEAGMTGANAEGMTNGVFRID